MAAELLGSRWETYTDLNPADADQLVDFSGPLSKPGPKINGSGTIGTMGHYCYFNMDEGTDADYTHPFDFPIDGDFTIVINALAGNLPNGTTMDVSVQGSVDGDNWVDLHLDIIDGLSIDNQLRVVVYDYDAKGRMPKMRLELTAASNASDETILLGIVPQ
jgi:hypothetical protein